MVERIPYARKQQQLPVILSAEEVVRFFAAVPSMKHRTALMTAYAAGLRVSEVVGLRVADIDSDRMLIRVEQGKGHRDRYVMLSARLLVVLRVYWQEVRPKHWLFPGREGNRPLAPATLHVVWRQACKTAKLGKAVNVHTLRHSFASHLLETGTEYPHDPGAARPSASVDHGALYPGRDDHDRQYDQPVRPAGPGENDLGLKFADHARA
jgi:integrase/recombinase XerD